MDFVGEFKEALKEAGFPVHEGTDYCKDYTKNHNNCSGCESENGCMRLTNFVCFLLGVLSGANDPEKLKLVMERCLDSNSTKEEIELLTA